MAPKNTMVREYESTRDFNRDAQKLSGQGPYTDQERSEDKRHPAPIFIPTPMPTSVRAASRSPAPPELPY